MRVLELSELMDVSKKFDTFDYGKYVTVDWHGTPIVVRHTLNMKDYVDLINYILMSMYDSEKNLRAELLDFIIKYHILCEYSSLEMPDDVDIQYKIIFCTDLYDTVIKNINQNQYKSILNSIGSFLGFTINF